MRTLTAAGLYTRSLSGLNSPDGVVRKKVAGSDSLISVGFTLSDDKKGGRTISRASSSNNCINCFSHSTQSKPDSKRRS
uniref:Uncharacterized protein n=1 Tax=Rhizophora mucronata TaxID=61149 RepID=A0A2P2Q7Y8_RHIMU